MSWQTLPPELRELALTVLTAKQMEALKLWDAGAGYRRIGVQLDISPSTARDRVQNAVRKLERAARERGLA